MKELASLHGVCVVCVDQLEEERAGSVEAAEVARQGVEDELQRCRERLRAVQVERNLLLVMYMKLRQRQGKQFNTAQDNSFFQRGRKKELP